MGALNQWTGIGHLGRDAELRYTPGGDPVLTFSIACTETWKTKAGERKEHTEWIRVVYRGKNAESVAEFCTKGKQLAVIGRLQTRKWKDKDGADRLTTEIRADRIVLLGSASREGRSEHVRDEDVGRGEPTTDLTDDDISF